MNLDREAIKRAIKKNPESHEKLTGRYYLTSEGILFVNGNHPRPVGAIRIPSFSDDHPFAGCKINDELINNLTDWFIESLQNR